MSVGQTLESKPGDSTQSSTQTKRLIRENLDVTILEVLSNLHDPKFSSLPS